MQTSLVESDFVSFGAVFCLPSETSQIESHCKLEPTQHAAHLVKVGLIYSSNQSHGEAVLPDALAYFLSLL